MYILANILRSKENQKKKFGQLIEHNMETIFLEKSFSKCSEGTIPGPFSKKSKLNISWINSLKFHTVCFYCVPSGRLSNYIKTKLQTTCFYLV